jgi:sugar-phosphatase
VTTDRTLYVDGVLFDSDGVLVASHSVVQTAWRRLASEYGLPIDTLLSELAGVRAADTLRSHLDGPTLDAAVRRLEDLEVALTVGAAAMPGAVELLAALPAGRWAIVTSASRRLALVRWRAAGIPVPPHIVTGDDVVRGKPDPEPYRRAADIVGVPIGRCVVFEDSASGASSARTAGATVVAVGLDPWPFAAHARMRDLTSVQVEPGPDGLAMTFSDR